MTPELLYNATNDGLNIIYYFYPQAREIEGKENGKFKMRETEKTPSASIKLFGNVWKVTDFGGDGVAMSPIDICMHEKNISFTEALYFLAAEFGVEGEGFSPEVNKPKWEKRPANENEPDGYKNFIYKKEFSVEELAVLGPRVKQEHCEALSYYAVESIITTKDGQTTIQHSTENYPIFVRENKYKDAADNNAVFYKIYEPLNYDKRWRFHHYGNKPARYVCGLDELSIAYEQYKVQQESWEENQTKENTPKENIKYQKLPQAIICSGERDALCIRALGYHPIWFNSESYKISEKEYKQISRCVERVYNIPDLDDAGYLHGNARAAQFIDMFTIWLPERLKKYKDRRGNPRKDFRDYCEIWSSQQDFKNLLDIGRPIQFWETIQTKSGKRLEINTDYLEYFLRCHGFVSIADQNSRTGISFVRIEGNVVKEVEFHQIKSFLKNYVEQRFEPVDVRNLINNSSRISETSLSLKTVDLDFETATMDSQTFFFQNAIWEVTADGVKELKHGESDRHVWDDSLIKHDVTRLEPSFTITDISTKEDIEPKFDITIRDNHTSKFFNYLTNASRIYWRKEFEPEEDDISAEETLKYKSDYKFSINGPRLNSYEVDEQKAHLLNKMFCLGYLMHRYKAENRAWCIFAMDNKIGADNESNGGSGKSFCLKSIKLFMKTVTLSGRNSKMTENNHIYERVTEHTGFILIDDAVQYLNFDFFFDAVTGDIQVNPKNTKSYEIPFSKAAKFGITSNYVIRRADPSTARRILYAVFSDYYHQKTEKNDYLETRTIYDDFGKNLFSKSYTEAEWNADLNFFVDCEQMYLSLVKRAVKVQPPMENVVLRGLLDDMTAPFYDWAMVYFSPGSENCDVILAREDAFTAFKQYTGNKTWVINRFTTALKAFCQYAEHIVQLDPEEMKNNQGRIIRKRIDPFTKKSKSYEAIYVQTLKVLDLTQASTNNEDSDDDNTNSSEDTGSDELPFDVRS